MNLAGFDYVGLGNHDFNFGKKCLEAYLRQLNAICLCANVQGVEGVRRTAVATLENGLRVGLTGVVTHYVNQREKPENLEGIRITDAFTAAQEALEELKQQQVDITVCIYHGGFENDLQTGELLSDTTENQGYRLCSELDFDVLLTGHQHQAKADLRHLFLPDPRPGKSLCPNGGHLRRRRCAGDLPADSGRGAPPSSIG